MYLFGFKSSDFVIKVSNLFFLSVKQGLQSRSKDKQELRILGSREV